MLHQGFEIYTKALSRPAAPSTPKKAVATASAESPQGVTATPATPSATTQDVSEPVAEDGENTIKMASLDDAVDGEEVQLNTEEIIDGLQVNVTFSGKRYDIYRADAVVMT